jgi:hypothetical protein
MSDEHEDEVVEVFVNKEMGEVLGQVSDGLDAVAMAIDKLTAMIEQKMNQLIASIDAQGHP